MSDTSLVQRDFAPVQTAPSPVHTAPSPVHTASSPAPTTSAPVQIAPAPAPMTPAPAPTPFAAGDAAPNGFIEMGLAPELVRAVADLGYTGPTIVQRKAIPLAMGAGHGATRFIDLMVSSQTGSGKTAAYLLPLLHTLIGQQAQVQAQERAALEHAAADAATRGAAAPKRPKRKDPMHTRHFKAATPGALILCPTRELAQQVAHDAIDLARHCRGLRVANVVGGMPYQMQIAKLQNASLVVATPGRLLDLQRSMQIKLDKVQFLVVDEADRMLDLGFSDDLAEINQLTSQRQQTMMFSATFAPRIQQLALRVMHDGGSSVQKLTIDSPQEKHANIRQMLYWADNAQHKRKLLDHWLRDTRINQAIVFASTQVECDALAGELQQAGFSAVALHGALNQGLRNRRLTALRDGQVQILVATDVAARGLDIAHLAAVINVAVSPDPQVHVHRIGRTGRGDATGLALNLASLDEMGAVGKIEQLQGCASRWFPLTGLTPTGAGPLLPPMVTIQILGGRKQKIRAGDLLGALTGELGFRREQIGKIDVNDFSTYVAVERAIGAQAAQRLNQGRVKGRAVKARLVAG
ncbi:DEAD/DEAH box helicase [Verminephrobacter sp. Larva24]|nr:DEAD/DEAH box helicase [Verminephrobacter sp. Larva24]